MLEKKDRYMESLMKGYVSVIIPVYNSEIYLKDCIESVINQTYNNIEIIIVDDGSTDSSGMICEEYKRKDPRVIVIHKKNGGISDARNVALDLMRGEYFTFVDSDDSIELDAIEAMVDSLWDSGCLMAAFGYSSEPCNIAHDSETFVISSEELLAKTLQIQENYSQIAVWGRLYSYKLFGDIRFSFGYMGCEDIEYTTQVLTRIDKCVCSEKVIYNYRIVDGSLSHKKRIYFPEIIQSRWRQYELVHSKGWTDLSIRIKSDFYRELLYYLSKEKDTRHRNILKKYIKKTQLSYEECKHLKGIESLRVYIEKILPTFFIFRYAVRCREDGIILQWK